LTCSFRKLPGRLGHEGDELFAHALGERALVDAGGEELDPFVLGLLELEGENPLELADVLQLARGTDDRVEVERLLGELGQLR
jgi:hypothetical protein